MILVDTTVWIDLFRNVDSPEVRELERLIRAQEDICVCGVILTEVLQGIRAEEEYHRTRTAFDAFLFLPMTQDTFLMAAELYGTARSRGYTIRNAVDCMIAAVAIEQDIPLLHHDRDFDILARLGPLKLAAVGAPTKPLPPRRSRRGLADR